MGKYSVDYVRLFNTTENLPREYSERFGYDLDSATACFADCNIDIEYAFKD